MHQHQQFEAPHVACDVTIITEDEAKRLNEVKVVAEAVSAVPRGTLLDCAGDKQCRTRLSGGFLAFGRAGGLFSIILEAAEQRLRPHARGAHIDRRMRGEAGGAIRNDNSLAARRRSRCRRVSSE